MSKPVGSENRGVCIPPECDAVKLYWKIREIVDKGDDVEIRKIKDHLKISKVTRKTDIEVALNNS